MGLQQVVRLWRMALVLAVGIAGCTSGTSPGAVEEETPGPPPTPLGGLAIEIVGLEGKVPGMVDITGPTIFHRTAVSDTVFKGLMPGPYLVTGLDVRSGGQSYASTPLYQSVTVEAGKTTSVLVQYGRASGALTVIITGLPDSVAPVVHLDGPDGLTNSYSGSFTTGPMATGVYTVRPESVYVNQERFNAPSARSIYLANGGTAVLLFQYVQGTGFFTVTIDGLPPGVDAAVRLVGEPFFDEPVFDQLIPASLTLHGMEIGYYNVLAQSVVTSSGTYVPSPDSSRTFVSPFHPGIATVTYSLAP